MTVGLVLVLVSAVAGSKVVAAADDTAGVWAAAAELVPGQPITPDQLRRVDVQLGSAASHYLAADNPVPADAVAARAVRAGELVAASAIVSRVQSRLKPVMVPVDSDSAGVLVAGSVVDVWVNSRQGTAASEAFGAPVLMLESAPVSRAADGSSARLGGARVTTGVQVMVPNDSVERLIGAIDQGARVTLVPVVGSPQRATR